MNDNLGVSWSEKDKAAGEKVREAWEEFFSVAEDENTTIEPSLTGGSERLQVAEVLARYEGELSTHPNVVGVAQGIRTKQGKPTGEPCIVVYVDRKVPLAELSTSATLPPHLEGIPIDVVEIGMPEAL